MYKKMADILTPVTIGSAQIDIMDFTKEIPFYAIIDGLQKEKYARLLVNGQLMMSETPMEHRTNRWFVQHAHGDVLVGGLGIGMVILPIQENPKVSTVTVIEKNIDVIAAIKSQLPFNKKVNIINDDVFTWKPDKRFDCIYMDIWPFVNEDVYEEMKKLKRKYGHYLKPKDESPFRFNRCWAENNAKNSLRL